MGVIDFELCVRVVSYTSDTGKHSLVFHKDGVCGLSVPDRHGSATVAWYEAPGTLPSFLSGGAGWLRSCVNIIVHYDSKIGTDER